MTAERWRQIENLFVEAVECPPSERHLLLDRVCRGDEELRRELESLLACDAPDERLLAIPEVPDASAAEDRDSGKDMVGRRIGPYRLIRLVGRGGMGAVYLGVRDDDQYQKQVAIKLLKRGMDTDFMLSRFRQERQILANLEHPFIARLIDGGATEDGLPYFVMEYVEGVPITQYCAEKNLSIPERLRLFRLVCEAVQYAHQNLVVHRDIKPSNILTTKEGIPKLLDFGIAKVLDPAGPANATLTQGELRALTPDYASPEQVKGSQISTASDTYSLGAVLYELLTGHGPHRFPSGSLTDMERTICEVEPQKPSSAAADKQLARRLSGDLDDIILTALRKEPQRRYASTAEFSEDLRRHLEALPVLAQGDRWTYRASKFIRRHRVGVGAALLVAASLVGGIVATTYQARRAERRFQIVRGLANTQLFELYSEMERLPGSMALRAATIRSVLRYLDDLAQDGSQDAGLDLEIAKAYERVGSLEGRTFTSNLGRSSQALSSYLKAITIFERLANRSELRSEAIRGLIDNHLHAAGMEALLGNPTAAAEHFKKASAIANEVSARGDVEIPPSTQLNLYLRLANNEYDRGSADGESAYYRKYLEVGQKWVAETHSAVAIGALIEGYRNLGSALARGGDLVGARESYLRAQDAAEELVQRPGASEDQRSNLVAVYTALGDLLAAPDDPNFGDQAGAIAHYQKAAAIAERAAANDLQNVNARRVLASCDWRLGAIWADDEPAMALGYARKAVSISEDLHAADPMNAEYRYHASRGYLALGEALHKLGRHTEAVQAFNQAIEHQNAIEAVSPERVWNLRVLSRTYLFMGRTLLDGGDPDRALSALHEALTVSDRMLGRAPSSMSHQLDRAEALEGIGAYYLVLAARPGVARARRAEWKTEALSQFEKSRAIWQDWTRRKVGLPYAGVRERRVTSLIASIDR